MGSIFCVCHPNAETKAQATHTLLEKSQYRGSSEYLSKDALTLGCQQNHGEASTASTAYLNCTLYGFFTKDSPSPTSSNEAKKLLHYWQKEGPSCIKNTGGQFSFIVYDQKQKNIYFGNSADGARPLFYHFNHEALYVATEIRQVISSADIKTELNTTGAVRTFLHASVPEATLTAYKNVLRCPPGDILSIALPLTDSPKRILQHWHPEEILRRPEWKIDEWHDYLAELLPKIMDEYLPTEPSALLLSGGIDSAGLWAIAKTSRKNTSHLRSISLIYPGWDSDEYHYIDALHKKLNSNGIFIDARDASPAEHLESEVASLDQWLWAGSTFQLDQTLNAAREGGQQSILTGLGADEWLLSQRGYVSDLFWQGHIFKAAKLGISYSGDRFPAYSWQQTKRFLRTTFLPENGFLRKHLRPPRPPIWLSDEWQEAWKDWYQERINLYIDKPIAQQQLIRLSEFRRSGITGESLEQRVAQFGLHDRHPYTDYRIMRFAFSIPADFVDRRQWKELQRSCFKSMLPVEILNRNRCTEHASIRNMAKFKPPTIKNVNKWALVNSGIADQSRLITHISNLQQQSYLTEIEYLNTAELFLRSRFM